MRRLGKSPIGTADGRSINVGRALEVVSTTDRSEAVDRILDDLAQVVVNVTTVIDPGRVVLGGPLSEAPAIASDLADRIRADAPTELVITVSPLGRNAPLSGAAVGALELARAQRGTKSGGSLAADAE